MIAGGKWPVLTHVGRSSGQTYRTPLDAHPVDRGYLFVLVYGSESDWVRNVLAVGSASLRVDGRDVALVAPRLVGRDEAEQALPADVSRPPKCSMVRSASSAHVLRISEFLRMDLRTPGE